jgi:hypothetical protein
MAEADHFFSRWSRRKAAVAQGVVLPEPVAPHPPVPQAKPIAENVKQSSPDVPTEVLVELPPLTMDDVAALTTESDFKPFVARDVAPEVRNAAMKTLFSDPHYNVMDRMDIYIDDYSQPDPLPQSMLRQMASAQFLNLFDDTPASVPLTQPDALHHANADLRLQPDNAVVGPEPGQSPERDADPAQRALPT